MRVANWVVDEQQSIRERREKGTGSSSGGIGEEGRGGGSCR